jgi:hypothetical protein
MSLSPEAVVIDGAPVEAASAGPAAVVEEAEVSGGADVGAEAGVTGAPRPGVVVAPATDTPERDVVGLGPPPGAGAFVGGGAVAGRFVTGGRVTGGCVAGGLVAAGLVALGAEPVWSQSFAGSEAGEPGTDAGTG